MRLLLLPVSATFLEISSFSSVFVAIFPTVLTTDDNQLRARKRLRRPRTSFVFYENKGSNGTIFKQVNN